MFRPMIVILALASYTLAASGSGVYKWVDEKGAVQYRDTPPPQGVTYQALKKSTGSQYDPATTLQQLREKVQGLNEARTATPKKSQEPVTQLENCERTQKNLDILATSINPIRVDDEGNRVPLNGADRQTAVAEQQRYLEQHCSS